MFRSEQLAKRAAGGTFSGAAGCSKASEDGVGNSSLWDE